MKIATMTYVGVKGRSRTLALSPRMILTGDVGKGKSTILDSLKIGLVGCVPSLGRSEAATARLLDARRTDLSVSLRLADERITLRRLLRDGGRLTSEARASWIPQDATATEHGNAIAALAGGSLDEAAQHVDIRELLSAGPGDRIRYVTKLLEVPGASATDKALRARLLAYARAAEWPKPVPTAEDGPDYPARGERFLALLAEAGLDSGQREALGNVGEVVLPLFTTKGLADALAEAKRLKAAADGEVKGKIRARAEIEARSVAAGTPTESLDALRTTREGLDRRIGGLDAEEEARKAHAVRLAKARADLLTAGTALAAAQDAARGAPALLADAEAAAAERAALVDPAAPAAPLRVIPNPVALGMEAALLEEAAALAAKGCEPYSEDELRAAERAARAALEVAMRRRAAAENRRSEAESDAAILAEAERSPWVRVGKIADELDALVTENERTGDPQAGLDGGAVSEHAAELRALATANAKDVEALRRSVAERRARIATAEAEAEEARKASEAADANVLAVRADLDRRRAAEGDLIQRIDALRTEARTLGAAARRGADEANAPIDAAHAEAVAAHGRHVAANATRRAQLEGLEVGRRKRAADDVAAVDVARATADGARAAVDRLDAEPKRSAEEIAAERAVAAADLASVKARLEALEAANARAKELGDIAGAILREEARAKASGAYAWAFERLREEDLAHRGGPLLDRMRTFLDATGWGVTPYLRAAKGSLDLGWVRADGREVGLSTLSGGETVVFLAALAAAVVALRKPEIRVLLVEAAELGARAPLRAVLAGLDAVLDDFDHVIVATNAPLDFFAVDASRDGWEIVDVESTPTTE